MAHDQVPLRRPGVAGDVGARAGATRRARSKTSATRRCSCPTTSATRELAPMPAIAMAAAAHDDAARRRARVRQRLQAPGDPRQGGGDDRPALRRPARARHRRGLDEDRLRRARPAVRPAGGARRPVRGGAARSSRAASAGEPFSFAGEHYTITDYDVDPEAGAAAAPADPRRRRRPKRAAPRGPRGRHRRHQPEPARGRGRPPTRRTTRCGEQTDAEDRLDPRGRGRPLRRHRAPDPLLRRARSPTTAWARRGARARRSASTPEEALESGVALVGTDRRDHATSCIAAPRGVGRVATSSSATTTSTSSRRSSPRLAGT